MKFKWKVLLSLFPSLVLFDQLTKLFVLRTFQFQEMKPIIPGFFDLTYVRNTGAAFGFLAESHPEFRVPFFLIMPILALVAIAYVLKKTLDHERRMAIALVMIISGALGNLIDRARFGFVVDFLYFHWQEHYFPAFNVADSAICVGVGLMLLDLAKKKEA